MDSDPFSTPGKGFFGSMTDYVRNHNDAFQQSLEPDPNADEITRIDQEWIKQCTRLVAIRPSGLMEAPNVRTLIGLIAGLGAVMAALLFMARSNGGLYCFAVFIGLFFILPCAFALFQTRKYFAAADAYRQRRAQALAARGLTDDRPLPVIDRPVWVQAGMMDVETALHRLDGAYRSGQVKSAEYMRTRAVYLEHATPEERQRLDQEPLWLNDRRR